MRKAFFMAMALLAAVGIAAGLAVFTPPPSGVVTAPPPPSQTVQERGFWERWVSPTPERPTTQQKSAPQDTSPTLSQPQAKLPPVVKKDETKQDTTTLVEVPRVDIMTPIVTAFAYISALVAANKELVWIGLGLIILLYILNRVMAGGGGAAMATVSAGLFKALLVLVLVAIIAAVIHNGTIPFDYPALKNWVAANWTTEVAPNMLAIAVIIVVILMFMSSVKAGLIGFAVMFALFAMWPQVMSTLQNVAPPASRVARLQQEIPASTAQCPGTPPETLGLPERFDTKGRVFNPHGCDVTYAVVEGEMIIEGPRGSLDARPGLDVQHVLTTARAKSGTAAMYYMLCPKGTRPLQKEWKCRSFGARELIVRTLPGLFH